MTLVAAVSSPAADDSAPKEHLAPQSPPGWCWDCGGPCLTWKGSVHGWRCVACCERYIDEAVTRGRIAARQRLEQKQRTPNFDAPHRHFA